MDKVIIDGVDVSGCEFSCENPLHEIKHSCNVRGYEKDDGLHIHLKCKDNPNCYYKQLKRLEQENERLKKEVSDLNFYIDSYRQVWEIGKYKQALQDIKNIAERTDGHHPASVINMVSVIRHTINSVIGEK